MSFYCMVWLSLIAQYRRHGFHNRVTRRGGEMRVIGEVFPVGLQRRFHLFGQIDDFQFSWGEALRRF
jgi:hypothetical protein